jgi:hypothetical protein
MSRGKESECYEQRTLLETHPPASTIIKVVTGASKEE